MTNIMISMDTSLSLPSAFTIESALKGGNNPEGSMLVEVVKSHRRYQNENDKTREVLLKQIEELKKEMETLTNENVALKGRLKILEDQSKKSKEDYEVQIQVQDSKIKKVEDQITHFNYVIAFFKL